MVLLRAAEALDLDARLRAVDWVISQRRNEAVRSGFCVRCATEDYYRPRWVRHIGELAIVPVTTRPAMPPKALPAI